MEMLAATTEELVELTAQIAQTEVGRTLEARPRYGVFKPDSLDVPAWEALLDADVNNLRHNPLTATLAYTICATEGSSQEVTAAVMTTAAIHDIPEVSTGLDDKGDIPHGMTDRDSEAIEYAFLYELARDPESPLNQAMVEQAVAVMEDSKRQPSPETEAGWLFWLSEKLGYFRTAVIAFDAYSQLQNGDATARLRGGLLWLWSDVMGNSYIKLAAQRHRFKSIDVFFRANLGKLDQMIQLTEQFEDSLYSFYSRASHGERRYDQDRELAKIQAAQTAHQHFKLVYSEAA